MMMQELKSLTKLATFGLVVSLLCSCSNKSPTGSQHVANANNEATPKMEITITSTAFTEGGMMPKQYTCDGQNISPPLAWSGMPRNAKTLALICDDPDAPSKTWVHWVLYDLPLINGQLGTVSSEELPENVPPQEKLGRGGKQGTNDFKQIGYGGPCPPSGAHRYFFKLYALDAETSLNPGATKDQLLKAMEGHIVAQGQLIGIYKR
jgi:Raf kinase inhibitor-like YbhB/YbcL family protein